MHNLKLSSLYAIINNKELNEDLLGNKEMAEKLDKAARRELTNKLNYYARQMG